VDGGDESTTVTFDFDAAGASMGMTVDGGAGTVRISGRAWGGVDAGNSYASPAFYDIDFTYSGVTANGTGVAANVGSGSIQKVGG